MLDRERVLAVVVFMMGSFYCQNVKCMNVSYTPRGLRTIAICAKP
jgi:hypothetical protein